MDGAGGGGEVEMMAAQASADPLGSSGAEQTLQSCLVSKEWEPRPFYPMLASREMGAVLGQDRDLGSGDSLE